MKEDNKKDKENNKWEYISEIVGHICGTIIVIFFILAFFVW